LARIYNNERELVGVQSRAMEDLEQVALSSVTANLEEAATWYYVVDCATCKAVIPFKYAPEDEPILLFPTMRVRCFHCHRHHTYAPEFISHRKAAAPCLNGDQRPFDASDGNRETARDRQEDRDEERSGGSGIAEPKIAPIRALSRGKDILNVALSGKRAAIFFLSSCLFAAESLSQLAFDFFYPVPLELRSSGPIALTQASFFGTVFLGLALFIFGIASVVVEAFSFKGGLIDRGFIRFTRIASPAVQAARRVALFLFEMWQRKVPAQDLPGALAGKAFQTMLARKCIELVPFSQAPSPENEPESSPRKWYSWRWLLARGRTEGNSP
jgi:hypothetical protein